MQEIEGKLKWVIKKHNQPLPNVPGVYYAYSQSLTGDEQIHFIGTASNLNMRINNHLNFKSVISDILFKFTFLENSQHTTISNFLIEKYKPIYNI